MEKPLYLPYLEAIARLRKLAATTELAVNWDWEHNRIIGNVGSRPWTFRLPICLPELQLKMPISRYEGHPKPAQTLQEYALSLPESAPDYTLILIQAGHSAIGQFAGGEVLHHKVIKKYMVRGNGRAQINYLGSRGKSKAGSRVRLANSVRFFEEINEKLIEWDCTKKATRIFVSCPVKILPIWFEADPHPPFARDDSRITKVPLDVQRPDFEQLQHVARQLEAGFWEGPHWDENPI